MSSNRDQTLTCADCGEEFTWGAGGQEFFREKGLTDPPRRCEQCRQAKQGRRGGVGRKGGAG
jgi:hypothetical protein